MIVPEGNRKQGHDTIDRDVIAAAHARITPYAHRTAIATCRTLDRLSGCKLFFKCENLQKTGAFKFRGATNAVFSLSDDVARRGVVTHSSGNHGAALASAAHTRGIPATIIMPDNAPQVKKDAVASYGADIRFCVPTLAAREETAQAVLDATDGVMIHPYDDERIIAGQATAALELLEEVPSLDVIIAPVGGGGLLSGTCLTAKLRRDPVAVIGAEPERVDDAWRSLQAGTIQTNESTDTVADGLKTALGKKTFPIIHEHVDEIGLVSEKEILSAMWLLIERAKIVAEPSAAVPLAAVLSQSTKRPLTGKRVGIILSGGNVDLRSL